MRTKPILAVVFLTALARGQELLWEVHSTTGIRNGGCYSSFGDYDHDGSEDLLVGAADYAFPTPLPLVRVFSGTDGSVLDELYHPYPYGTGQFGDIGDFDLDGFPDVILSGVSGTGMVEVWSIATKSPLLRFQTFVPSGPYGSAIRSLDCTGDGLPDLVYSAPNGTIYVHDHSGTVVYMVPAYSLGFIPSDITGVGDLDGDACDDFIVGAIEWFTGQVFGAVILVSGRTGTALRIHWGPQPGDGINKDVRAAGDVDGDGVMDYAAGNYGGQRGLVLIWSGATGALIRQWEDTNNPHLLGGLFLAGRDVDLDGRPDIIDVVGGYPNVPGQSAYQGRVRTFSSRDGQELVHVASQQWTYVFGDTYADLGVQPGNPYPVFAICDTPIVPPYNNWARIRVYRCSPAGTTFQGAGCSSTAMIPTIGIRRTDGSSNDGSRLLLGSAPANALAICVVAGGSMTGYGGITTPFPLDLLGMQGCDLLVPPMLLEPRLTGSAGMDRGYAAFDFPSTMAPINGTLFAAQWVVLDPVTLAHAATQRYEFRLQ